jgi:hypothetical protein
MAKPMGVGRHQGSGLFGRTGKFFGLLALSHGQLE